MTFFCVSRSTMPRRVRRHIVARRQAAELGDELLALLADHEVGRQARRVRVRRLRVHADLAEHQRDRIDRPDIDRAAGELHVIDRLT